jgi:hypothetical protein
MWMKNLFLHTNTMWGRCVLDRVVIGFTTIIVVSVYRRGEFEFRSWRGVLHTTLWDKVYSDLQQAHGFLIYSSSSTN